MTSLFNLHVLFSLLVAHALCDFPLQGDFLARFKNHTGAAREIPWAWCLLMHATIHAGAVALVTHSLALGLAELLLHIIIDYLKSDGRFGFALDQWLHVVCKIAWWGIACL